MTTENLKTQFTTALVTGGAGFVGSHLVGSLLDEGLRVISIDDYSAGKEENLLEFATNPNLTIIKADVSRYEQIESSFKNVDVVFHQAVSKNTVCMEDPRRDLEINAQGTLNVLEASRHHGVKKFVHASTGSVYGDAEYYPTDEKHPVNPNSYYGVSKLAAEKYVRLYHHLYQMDTTMLRYFHVYGPRQEYSDVGGVVSIFGRRAIHNQPLTIYGDGSQLRSFTHVNDIVNINKFVATRPETTGQAYNCASAIKVTIQELAEAVLAYYGKTELAIEYADWKPGDVKVFDVDNQKIKNLGFNFQYSFEDGLFATLSWLEQYFAEVTCA